MRSPLLLLLPLVACRGANPTWHADVAPIVASRCVGCHTEGGITPFSLESYEEAARFASLIADAVADRRMPPGPTNRDCASYTPDPNLSEDEIATIVAWAEGGAEEGDPADAVLVEPQHDPDALDRVDLTVQMTEPYTPQNAPDDYRCFTVDWPGEEETYITGFGVQPGNPKVVHHVILYAIPPSARAFYEDLDAADEGPGYTCFGGPGATGPANRPQWVGGWTPGQEGRNMPEGTGMAVEPGSLLILEMHYYVGNDPAPAPDQSAALLRVDDTVDRVGVTQPMADPAWLFSGTMEIPAGEAASFSYEHTFVSAVRLHDVGMHMHHRGQSGSLRVLHADGSETCALQLDSWDFAWQKSYRLDTPIELEAGDQIEVTCDFLNGDAVAVGWGESTDDEMCLGIAYVSSAP